jgi:SAM-dependent methyltransferase
MSDTSTRWGRDGGRDAGEYDAQWARMEAAGVDPHGEVVFVQGYRPASVLDAGCGTGRVAIELARRGVDVVGVDLDPHLLEAARTKAPGLAWQLADVTTVDLGRTFDVVVLAGNVMIFLAPGTEGAALANLGRHVAPGGRLIAGFQVHEHRLPLAAFDAAATAAGFAVVERHATWDREPYEGGDYAVSVLARA